MAFDLGSFQKEKIRSPAFDLLAWLSHQTIYPKVYWKDRDRSCVRAAIGNLCPFSEIPCLLDKDPDFTLYGGMRFHAQRAKDPCWEAFPQVGFWAPQIEVVQDEWKTEILVNASGHETPLQCRKPLTPKTLNPLCLRTDTPNPFAWKRIVNAFLDEIAHGRVEKVVAARKTILEFENEISPWPLIQALKEKAARATLFAIQFNPHLCFFGATPEKLFDRRGRNLETDAVAGTRPRGNSPEEDLLLEKEMLKNPKDLREFSLVKCDLETLLSPHAEHWAWDGPDRILKNTYVQHIYNRMKALLKEGVTDADLIRSLHPTPALGGAPRQTALDLIKELEPFDRGWYGAPIGIIQPHAASFAVGIRSGLIEGNLLHLFAGTGIVPGSQAEQEWEELEQKIHPITSLYR